MNLTNIRSFYTIVTCNSISKAAKKLHVTQPGLSMQLQSLENNIGEKLLNRSNKGVELTKEGSLVFSFAESMLSLEDNLKKKLEDLKKTKDTLLLSCCKDIGEQIIPCSIYTFKEIHSNVEISMNISNSNDIIKKLLNHETNIGIIQKLNNIPENLELIPFIDDKLVLVGSIDCKTLSASINDISSLPLILREEDSATLETIKDFLKNLKITINDINSLLSLNSPESIKSTISSGRGYSWLPNSTITHELRNKTLRKLSAPDLEIPISYCIAIRKNYSLTMCEKNLIDFLTSKKRCFCY